jgi:hypothetical protein
MRLLTAILALLLASGTLMEATHHHEMHDEGPVACCGSACSSHHGTVQSPAIVVPVRVSVLPVLAPELPSPKLFSKELFRPPAS